MPKRLQRAPKIHDPEREYQKPIYLDKQHAELPRVSKFSGEQSSRMLIRILLVKGILKAVRGNVVLFGNISCEPPYTYDIVRKCKAATEQHGVPLFFVNFQPCKDARNDEWERLQSHRLANGKIWSRDNQDGFHRKGKVFEEVVFWSGIIPNQLQYICTTNTKLGTIWSFLRDWLAGKTSIPCLGHCGSSVSRINRKVRCDLLKCMAPDRKQMTYWENLGGERRVFSNGGVVWG